MCASTWTTDCPIHIEQRTQERNAPLMESFPTLTYNVMRQRMPEAMQTTEK